MKDKVIHRELSYKIMQAVFEVHNTLGPGFKEIVYEEALAYEFELKQIPFKRQTPFTVTYKGRTVGRHRADFIVDDKVIVELKAVAALTDGFKQQTTSYIKAIDLRLGILVNFGTPRVESTRIAN